MNQIELQLAYATQLTGQDEKGPWIVYSESNENLYELPKEWTEKQVMTAIHFARDFELKAFNKGISFQKTKEPETIKSLQALVTNLSADKEIMKRENIKIADELDRLTVQYSGRI